MRKEIAITVLSFLNLLIFSFIGLNYDAFSIIMNYKTPTPSRNIEFNELISDMQAFLRTKIQSAHAKKEEGKEIGIITQDTTRLLTIPKLQLIAPIHNTGKLNNKNIQELLKRGTVIMHTDNKASKQQIILGHSSDYSWNENPYGTIFTLLPKLQKGDIIKIIKGKETITYSVRRIAISDRSLSGLIDSSITEDQIILSTCYPIGFTSKRYNVIANKI